MQFSKQDDDLPLQYINNENPFAFSKDYFENPINLSKNKERLNAFHRLQPQRVELYLDPQQMMQEQSLLVDNAIEKRKKDLIHKGLSILNLPRDEVNGDIYSLFEENFDKEEIINISFELRKLDLLFSQMKVRSNVSQAIQIETNDTIFDVEDSCKYDNLKEAMIFEELTEQFNK